MRLSLLFYIISLRESELYLKVKKHLLFFFYNSVKVSHQCDSSFTNKPLRIPRMQTVFKYLSSLGFILQVKRTGVILFKMY